MKRIISTVLAAVAAAGILGGCGQTPAASNNSTNIKNDKPAAAVKEPVPSLFDGETISSSDLGLAITASLKKAYKTVGDSNPISSNVFFADPTAVEYDGRLYVYGTCDQQEFKKNNGKGSNSYGSINSLACYSTDDMLNWTYHGTIPVTIYASWAGCSWAPSIVSRVNKDGETEFFLYFCNSGGGVGVLKSNSPTGPWHDPIGKPLVTNGIAELADDPVFWCFDPGVCIDESGVGWLAFGGGDAQHKGETGLNTGNCRIVKLGEDMVSLASKIQVIEAPYHFEANELNYINGKYILTYCSNWAARDEWPSKYKTDRPQLCTMCYMVSTDPLKPNKWEYKGEYVLNPTSFGYPFSNNHTHMQEYQGKYYLFYQNVSLLRNMNIDGADGYRSIGVNDITVNEKTGELTFSTMNDKGVAQIKNYDVFARSEAETCNVCAQTNFKKALNRIYVTTVDGSWSCITSADFGDGAKQFAASVLGKGIIEIRIDKKDGEVIGSVQFDTGDALKTVVAELDKEVSGVHDLYFVFGGEFSFDEWQFAK